MALDDPTYDRSLFSYFPSIAVSLSAYLLIAGTMVAARIGFDIAGMIGMGQGSTSMSEFLDQAIELVGIDGLIEHFYGWMIDSQEFAGSGYFELGVALFAPIGPAAGAIWFRRLAQQVPTLRDTKVVLAKAIELAGMVLWCYLFGWALVIFIWIWPLAAFYFLFKMDTFDEGSNLIRNQTWKGLGAVSLGLFLGVALA